MSILTPSPDDWLYRRVSRKLPFLRDGVVSSKGLGPNRGEVTGMSVTLRSLANSPLDALSGKPAEEFVIAKFQVIHILDAGFSLRHSPMEGNPGHCDILGATFGNRTEKAVVQMIDKLCRPENLLLTVLDPGNLPPEEMISRV